MPKAILIDEPKWSPRSKCIHNLHDNVMLTCLFSLSHCWLRLVYINRCLCGLLPLALSEVSVIMLVGNIRGTSLVFLASPCVYQSLFVWVAAIGTSQSQWHHTGSYHLGLEAPDWNARMPFFNSRELKAACVLSLEIQTGPRGQGANATGTPHLRQSDGALTCMVPLARPMCI